MTEMQGDLITPAPRANRLGNPCPAWCTADHDTLVSGGVYITAHSSPSNWIDVGTGGGGMTASALKFASEEKARISVLADKRLDDDRHPFAHVYPSIVHAGPLADLLEILAEATPAQHRELAAQVRAAAALAGGAE